MRRPPVEVLTKLPEVIEVTARLVEVPLVENELVVVEFEAKKFVEVALVVVPKSEASREMVELATTYRPRVVDVGARAPNELIDRSRNCEA
jgi:acetolactate synthase small subunit